MGLKLHRGYIHLREGAVIKTSVLPPQHLLQGNTLVKGVRVCGQVRLFEEML